MNRNYLVRKARYWQLHKVSCPAAAQRSYAAHCWLIMTWNLSCMSQATKSHFQEMKKCYRGKKTTHKVRQELKIYWLFFFFFRKSQCYHKKYVDDKGKYIADCSTTVMHAGANVQKGKSLESPLHAAAEKDCTDVVKLLLDFGADINARNTEFQRPVDVAPPSSLTEGFLLLYEGMKTSANFLCRIYSSYLRKITNLCL